MKSKLEHCVIGFDKRVIISLTSYPKRIEYAIRVVKSLLLQTYENIKIVMYLSKDEFFDREYVERMYSFAPNDKFVISWVDGNIRSFKKFYYAFSDFPDDIVVTVDDDVEYSETMLEELLQGHVKCPKSVISRRTHLMTRCKDKLSEYETWYRECKEFIYEPRMDLFATGVGGILYPPHIFDLEVFNKDSFLELCPYGDDLWLKTMEIRNNVKTVYVQGKENDCQIEDVGEDGLYQRHNCRNGNDTQIYVLIRNYKNELIQNMNINDLLTTNDSKKMRENYIMNDLLEIIKKNEKCYIYGAGFYGKLFLNYIESLGYIDKISAFLVNDVYSNEPHINNVPIVDYRTVSDEEVPVIIALSFEKQKKVWKDLVVAGFSEEYIFRLNREHLYVLDGHKFIGSALYWEERYNNGGNSGSGSYNRLASFKAEIINDFIKEKKINSVIEWGCGDGNQLSLLNINRYLGYDVSSKAISICRKRFENDKSKNFVCSGDSMFHSKNKAEMSMSLDVLYHLVEDEVFERYMQQLFESSTKYVCIYSCDFEEDIADHVRCRKFSEYVSQKFSSWKLINYIKNRYPYDLNDVDNTSFSDFFFYEKIEN